MFQFNSEDKPTESATQEVVLITFYSNTEGKDCIFYPLYSQKFNLTEPGLASDKQVVSGKLIKKKIINVPRVSWSQLGLRLPAL